MQHADGGRGTLPVPARCERRIDARGGVEILGRVFSGGLESLRVIFMTVFPVCRLGCSCAERITVTVAARLIGALLRVIMVLLAGWRQTTKGVRRRSLLGRQRESETELLPR